MRSRYILVKSSELSKIVTPEQLGAIQGISTSLEELGVTDFLKKKIGTKVDKAIEVKDEGSKVIALALSSFKANNSNFNYPTLNPVLSSVIDLNKAAKCAREFCKTFDLDPAKQSSVILYIEVVEKLVSKERLNVKALGYSYEKAVEWYTKYLALGGMDEGMTAIYKQIRDKYVQLRAKSVPTQFVPTHDEKYNFYLASKFCHEYSIDPEMWVVAQFEGLAAFATGTALASQLVGEKAQSRYVAYAQKHKKNEQVSKDFSKMEGITDYMKNL